MKILFGIPFLYPAIAYGGAARAAYDLAKALQRSGQQISVLTTDVWDQNHRFTDHCDPAPFEVLRLRNLSNSMAYWFQFYTVVGFKEKADLMLNDVDVVHLHTYRNLLNDRLARAAYRANIPFILTAHGTIPIIERFHQIKRFYDSIIGRWQLEHAAAIIAVSEPEKEKLESFGIPESKIRVIPNGIPEIHPSLRGKFRERWRIGSNQKLVLFLGKITERKGLQFVVHALSQLGDVKLVIAGNDMGYQHKVERIIKRLGLSGKIIQTGLLNDEEKTAALTDADVTVYPSRDETFGLVAVESILCGTPVIVGNDDGCAQLIKKVGAGDLVGWGNVDELAHAIQGRLAKGRNLEEMRKAKEILSKEYTWKGIAAETLKLYQRIGSAAL
ncbi:MAG TPA: glycosyltransferase family 4 protein [Acidobacteriota bacterium]|nr:glycosyltransferase family 4 protein [Acidobacteriota bacterium]